jgi:hypothetical protein
MAIVAESKALAADLGVLDKAVFFNNSWVDFADRHNYLLEADAGVSTHYSHVETTFSFRTRILDYLWAGLPMVVTAGDHFAELIEHEGLGLVVDAEDVDGLTLALEKALWDEDFIATAKKNIERVRPRFEWERALEPLVSFVSDPHHAADNEEIGLTRKAKRAKVPATTFARRSGVRHDLGRSLYYLRVGGPAVVARKIVTRLRGAR